MEQATLNCVLKLVYIIPTSSKLKTVVCCVCNSEKQHHAKGMCKPCYRKSEPYKNLRKSIDKKFQSENKDKIYEVRKKRRTSEKYKESDGYVKNLIATNFGLSMSLISKYPEFIKSKKNELKIKKIIKNENYVPKKNHRKIN